MGGRSGVLLAAFGICILLMAKQVRASVCTPSSGIYHLSSQQDLDELWSDCTVINGSIDMECDTSLPANERIRELEVFSLVQEVRGYLRIRKCDDLGSLEGLQRLERIAGFKLYNEPGARQGFAMYIENNAIIGDLAGLRSLKQIQGQGKRGAARVSIKTNDNLCYMDLVGPHE
ncbi:uncharacterized protein MONBRDRAFT_6320 [Monosiga brevicollis MX1]|uniref:Receptor L-domain domain-containing protein n=1 Tax=Monosiga brevicollis TaxID=81824 RepID=A9UTH7_MONBE|nr:uncharacterized protein MONBRDRAFT_6320 [Monosiga brevicollis MX1]EDQ91495.1 predicted protein [Monosiga brevicollis MX1]|eukprot:XP_001743917.1 hypothetical protein [Monosiga brevicollis MX1]